PLFPYTTLFRSVDALHARIVVVQVAEQGRVVVVSVAARQVGPGMDHARGVVDEVLQPDQRHRMAAVDGGAGEADGGVVVLLGRHVVDDEAEAQGAVDHGLRSRGSGVGWAWWSSDTSRRRHWASASRKPGAVA